MKRILSIVLTTLVWVVIIAYFAFVRDYITKKQDEQLCQNVEVRVLDSAGQNFITSSMVKAWFASEGIALRKRPIAEINTAEIESFVRRRGFIKTARVYKTINGTLHIDITQRHPILRVNSINNYNFYLTDDNYILPLQTHYVVYVPVVTGTLLAPFDINFVGSLDDIGNDSQKKVSKNYLFLANLINFVKFVRDDDFWNSFIVQINITDALSEGDLMPKIELVPRAGDQIIILGDLSDFEGKLVKLMNFYRNAVAYEGWDNYSTINIEYNNQIVCTKKAKIGS